MIFYGSTEQNVLLCDMILTRITLGKESNMKRNYQKELEQQLAEFEKAGQIPTLLLHSCCAPCSSYVLEYLAAHMKITVYYYNPNIFPREEYEKRVKEQDTLISKLNTKYPIEFCSAPYSPEGFYRAVKGYEDIKEGGERCFRCFRLRLNQTAEEGAKRGFDYFTTTLSISPMKNAGKLNEIGEECGTLYGIHHLPSDFKKKNGYKRSVELSSMFGLYRQDYCGCIFSKKERELQKNIKTKGKED